MKSATIHLEFYIHDLVEEQAFLSGKFEVKMDKVSLRPGGSTNEVFLFLEKLPSLCLFWLISLHMARATDNRGGSMLFTSS